ncbi:MAG: SRPBCC family protein [Gallionellaceae bacterium]|nr:MAG: SRPBCC family protein [Gallionellaceae bacterium]
MLNSAAGAVFSHLDDHSRLSAHMTQASWMMAGGQMRLEIDGAQGHATGSRIRLSGRVLGIALEVEEIVTDYRPPLHKRWETTGTPKLLVIGNYSMGFEIVPQGNSSRLRIFIDYALPESLPAHWLGRVFGGWYARWCTQRMVGDVEKYFH